MHALALAHLAVGAEQVLLVGDLERATISVDLRLIVVAHLRDDNQSITILTKATLGVLVLLFQLKLCKTPLLIVADHARENITSLVLLCFFGLALLGLHHEDVDGVLVGGARQILGNVQVVERQRVDVRVRAAATHLLEGSHWLRLGSLLCVEEADDGSRFGGGREVVARFGEDHGLDS